MLICCLYLQLMSDEDDGLPSQLLLNGMVKDVVTHVSIQGTEGVVQDVDVPVAVKCSSQTDPLTLTATQISTAFSNLGNK